MESVESRCMDGEGLVESVECTDNTSYSTRMSENLSRHLYCCVVSVNKIYEGCSSVSTACDQMENVGIPCGEDAT